MNKAHSIEKSAIDTRRIVVTALGMALVCILTMAIKVPLPAEGYAHLGNFPIFLFAAFFGPLTGFLAGGVGSAMADLLSGFGHWALPTLIIKGIMGLLIGVIAKNKHCTINMGAPRTFFACLLGLIEMTLGYTIAGALMTGNIITGISAIWGYIGEGVIGIIIFYIAGGALKASGILKIFKD